MSQSSSQPDSPLRCTGLGKAFHLGRSNLTILQGLDADFLAPQLTTIQGNSGSGKSTLLQILGGLEPPDQGEVLWRGQSIYRWPPHHLAKWRSLSVGFVFQSYHLFPEFSALENVEFPARLARRGNNREGIRLLEQAGLGGRLNHRPAELSGGEQQRVAIARALRNRPALLLADEPTGNLDAQTGRAIVDLLFQLQEELQLCFLLVTHDDALAKRGQRHYRLHSGKLWLAEEESLVHSV